MKTIHRYVVPANDLPHQIELTGPIVHVATRAEVHVELWAVVDPEAAPTAHAFQVIGTGHPMPEGARTVVGTAVTPSGRLVWHLVELGGPA